MSTELGRTNQHDWIEKKETSTAARAHKHLTRWQKLTKWRLISVLLVALFALAGATEGWWWAWVCSLLSLALVVYVFRISERHAKGWQQLQAYLTCLSMAAHRAARDISALELFDVPDDVMDQFPQDAKDVWLDLGLTGDDGFFRFTQIAEAPGSGVAWMSRFVPSHASHHMDDPAWRDFFLSDPDLGLRLQAAARTPERVTIDVTQFALSPSLRWVSSPNLQHYTDTIPLTLGWRWLDCIHRFVLPLINVLSLFTLILRWRQVFILPAWVPTITLLVSATVNWMMSLLLSHKYDERFVVVQGTQDFLRKLSQVCLFFEHVTADDRYKDTVPHEWRAAYPAKGRSRSSRRLNRLNVWIQGYRLQAQGMIGVILNGLIGLDSHVFHGINIWSQQHGDALPMWLALWQKADIYNSLTTHAHVMDTVEGVELESDEDMLVVKNLNHPLIPESEVVGNDFGEGEGTIIITGSNMSGKSTFLRTIGLSVLMAQAGCPVVATQFQWRPVKVLTSIRNEDQLSKGVSRFYAEVLRVKRMRMALDEGVPLLLLIDEMFHGTNAADRLYGAKEALKILRGPSILTIVTTHDDALCDLERAPAVNARNFHFEDREEDQRLVFDYQLKKGRATRTNARTLLRLAGLLPD